MLGWILLLALVGYVVYTRLTKRFRDVERMFGGPWCVPLFGNALYGVGRGKDDVYNLIEYFHTQYTGSFRIWFGPLLYVFLNEPKHLESLLGSTIPLDKSDMYQFLWPWLGDGLLTSTGEKWRRHRKMLTPAFHFKILDSFIQVFNRNEEVLCSKLMQHDRPNDPFDIYQYVKLCALDNICETAMGIRIDAQLNPKSQYVRAVEDESTIIFLKTVKFWLRLDWIFKLTKTSQISKKALQIIHGLSEDVIKQRKLEFQKTQNNMDEFNMKGKMSFIDILLQAAQENGLTDEDIRAEVDTFMFEGHDTVTSGISFSFYNIAHHPAIQDQIMKELDEIFGSSKRPPTYRDLQEMKYLEQVIKESLRLYPSVPVIGRTLLEDFPLGDGKYLPKDTLAVVWMPAVHKNPQLWDNPDEFDPSHFSPESIQKRHPYAFLPFSAGPRNCIGQKFAMLELKATISSVLRKFHLFPSSNPEHKLILKTEVVLNTKSGMHICVKSRKDVNHATK